jgi:hypothetical protein
MSKPNPPLHKGHPAKAAKTLHSHRKPELSSNPDYADKLRLWLERDHPNRDRK